MTARTPAAGAKILAEPKTQFYGERSARFQGLFSHMWMLGQNVEDVSPKEMRRHCTDLLSQAR